MIVAIPLDAREKVFHLNPCACSVFALYEVTGNRKDTRYRYIETRLNPWKKYDGAMVNDPKMRSCECECEIAQNPQHISEHYALLEVIGKSDYLIADQYCLNTLYAIKNVGIKLHKIPPFVKTAQDALEHLIIGTELTDNLRYVHPA